MADSPPRRPGFGAAIAAAEQRARRSLLRNHGGGHAPVSNLELFFDLVFVFAITQVSRFLFSRPWPQGVLEAAVLFLAVWWMWMYTTWGANWLNPDRLQVRIALMLLMLGSLVLAIALPHAFDGAALPFALTYVVMQIGRTLWLSLAFRGESAAHARNFLRIAIWFVASALPWLAGALRPAEERAAWWIAALAIEYAGPFAFFRVPGLGRSRASDWDISPSHMAERCGLFIIIALGEGIVVIGSTAAGLPGSNGAAAALVLAFAGSALMWWLYFDMGAERGARFMGDHTQPGRIARNAYTYLHMPIVGGIVVLAVADELVMLHPLAPAQTGLIIALAGGTALFLGGLAAFKRITSGNPWFPASHANGLFLLAAVTLWAWLARPSAVIFHTAVVGLLVLIAVWEWGSFHGGWLERMERRNWWLGRALRRRIERRTAQFEARRAAKKD